MALFFLVYNQLPILTVTNESSVVIDTVYFRGLKPESIQNLEPGKTESLKIVAVTVENFVVSLDVGGEIYRSDAGGYLERRGGYTYHFIIKNDYTVTLKDRGYFGIF